jgi:hypothetical protein
VRKEWPSAPSGHCVTAHRCASGSRAGGEQGCVARKRVPFFAGACFSRPPSPIGPHALPLPPSPHSPSCRTAAATPDARARRPARAEGVAICDGVCCCLSFLFCFPRRRGAAVNKTKDCCSRGFTSETKLRRGASAGILFSPHPNPRPAHPPPSPRAASCPPCTAPGWPRGPWRGCVVCWRWCKAETGASARGRRHGPRHRPRAVDPSSMPSPHNLCLNPSLPQTQARRQGAATAMRPRFASVLAGAEKVCEGGGFRAPPLFLFSVFRRPRATVGALRPPSPRAANASRAHRLTASLSPHTRNHRPPCPAWSPTSSSTTGTRPWRTGCR